MEDFKESTRAAYNRDRQQRSGVTYHLINGKTPDSSRSTLGKIIGQVFGEIENDGVVPTISGLLLPGENIDRLEVPESHATLLGQPHYFTPNTESRRCLERVLLQGQSSSVAKGSRILHF